MTPSLFTKPLFTLPSSVIRRHPRTVTYEIPIRVSISFYQDYKIFAYLVASGDSPFGQIRHRIQSAPIYRKERIAEAQSQFRMDHIHCQQYFNFKK